MALGYRKPNYRFMFNNTRTGIPFKLFTAGVSKYRSGGSKTKTQTKRNMKSGVVTTAQYDKKLMYRKRRAPARIRRLAKRANRRFIKQSLRLVGTNTVVFNESKTATTNNTTAPQQMLVANLSGLNGVAATEIGSADLNSLVSNDTRIQTSGKLLIKTAMLDLTVINVAATPLECDIYELSYRDGSKQTNFRAMIDQAAANTPGINGAASGLNIVTRGVQLFDFPELMKYGVQVLKKTKVFLPGGNTATYSMHLSKPQWITAANDIQDTTGFVKPYYTRTLAFVFKPVVNTTADTASLAIGVTRKYCYKIFEDDRDADNQL